MIKKFSFDLKQGQSDYKLLPVEFIPEQIPFEVKRTYFVIAGETNTQTGQHAHFKEKEVFLMVKGSADLISIDSEKNEYSINLKKGEAVYIPNLVWHGFKNIAAHSVICAFSSTHHNSDRNDYQEDKEKFINQ